MYGSDSFASSDEECDTICLPRGDPRFSPPSASFHHSSTQPSTSFNCSLDFLSGHHNKFCLDLNVDMCSAYCTCLGSGVCGFCSFSPNEVLSSSFNIGSFSLNVSSSRLSFRRRGFRDHNREERLTSLRGIVKHPKLYRTKKMHNISEALIYSLSSTAHVPRSPRWMSTHRSLARSRKMHSGRSRIPVSTTLSTILEVVEREDDLFSSAHTTDDQFGLQNLHIQEDTVTFRIKEEPVDVKPVVEATQAVAVNYEGFRSLDKYFNRFVSYDLCSRMNVMHPSHDELDERMVAQLQHGLETCTLSTDI